MPVKAAIYYHIAALADIKCLLLRVQLVEIWIPEKFGDDVFHIQLAYHEFNIQIMHRLAVVVGDFVIIRRIQHIFISGNIAAELSEFSLQTAVIICFVKHINKISKVYQFVKRPVVSVDIFAVQRFCMVDEVSIKSHYFLPLFQYFLGFMPVKMAMCYYIAALADIKCLFFFFFVVVAVIVNKRSAVFAILAGIRTNSGNITSVNHFFLSFSLFFIFLFFLIRCRCLRRG